MFGETLPLFKNSLVLKEKPIRSLLRNRPTLILDKPLVELMGLDPPSTSAHGETVKEKIRTHVRSRLEEAAETKIPLHLGYSYDRGELTIDRDKYVVGQISLTGFGDTVKEEIERVFGELRYTVGGFREETFENEKVHVHYYASFGYLSITVRPK